MSFRDGCAMGVTTVDVGVRATRRNRSNRSMFVFFSLF